MSVTIKLKVPDFKANPDYDYILEEGREATLPSQHSEMGDIFAGCKGSRDKF